MEVKDFFVEKLKEILKERDLTQSELSKRTGISIAYISQLLQGKKTPTIKVVVKIAEALNVPPSYFLEKSDAKVLFYADKDLTEDDIRAIEAFIDYLKKRKSGHKETN